MYRWQTEEYSKRVDEFHQKPEEYMECYKNHATPMNIKNHIPRSGVLSEKGMRILGNMTGWFDTEAICEIARDGIDLGCTLPDGPRGGTSMERGSGRGGIHDGKCSKKGNYRGTPPRSKER